MKRVSKYKLENGKIYKIWNKRLGELIIFKILTDDIREVEAGNIDINKVYIYLRKQEDIIYKYKEGNNIDLKLFKDDILYELTEGQLFGELL